MSTQLTELNARDYLLPLVRRWWLVLLIVGSTTVAAYAYYSSQPKVFEASTKILIAASGNPLDPAAGELSDRTIQDQAGLLTSRDVGTKVAQRLGRPEDAAALARSIATFVSPGSSFVTISARRPSAADAATIANAFAREFVRMRSEAVRVRVNKAISATRDQLDELPATEANSAERASLADSIRQLRLNLAVSQGSASQVDPALAPTAAVSPRPKRGALIAFVVSLIGSVALAFALEAFDRRPRRLNELSRLYDLPVLAAMPHAGKAVYENDGQAAVAPEFKEPLRQLRTNIQLSALDEPFRRILVTSAIAGEGKSTVVRNLALVLREGGQRVAVIDADLRRPTLAKFFKHQESPGLTDVLAGTMSLRAAMVNVAVHVEGLDALARMGEASAAAPGGARTAAPELGVEAGVISLLPAGPQPPDPQAVLSADRMRLLLEHLSTQYDVVLIDSPPLLHVTDALALAGLVDAVVLVARIGLVTRENARRVPEVLGKVAGARAIGIVVNDASPSERDDYGYGYGYG